MTTQLTPKQREFLLATARETLFGGTAGFIAVTGYRERTANSLIRKGLIFVGGTWSAGQTYYPTDAGREALKEIGGKAND